MLSDSVQVRRLVLVLLCCATLVLLALLSSALLTRHAASSREEVHASLLLAQAALSDCPDARKVDPKDGPVLDFCSPKYAGNVNGPVGSHIVLLGQNFPAQPKAWVITQNKNIGLQDVQACLASGGTCAGKVLQNAAAPKQVGQGEYEFFWTWNPPNFPTTPQDYYFATELTQKSIPPKPVLVVGSVAFTLTSIPSPCISINNGNGVADCSRPQSFTLTSGSSFTLQGSNWLLNSSTLPPTPTIAITTKCAAARCSQNLLSQSLTIPLDASGAFSQTIELPKNVTGKYIICASYQVQSPPPLTPVATPGQDFNTVILNTDAGDIPFNGSLTFGCKGDTTALILTVNPQPIPSPTPTPTRGYENVLDIVSYAGILLAMPILLLCLYFFWQSRKASPQTVGTGQQKSLSGALVNNNLSFPTSPNMTTTADRRVTANNQDAVKRAVGELVQSKPEMAVQLAKQALISNRAQWNLLLQAIEKEPRAAPANVGDIALSSVKQAKQDKQNELEHICKAVILYRWFINTRRNSPAVVDYWHNLGHAYNDLSSIVPIMSSTLLADALACYRVALSIYQPQRDYDSCFATSRNIGDVYLTMSSLPEADQQLCLYAARSYYQDALNLTRDQKRKQEIQGRIRRVEKELSVH